MKAVASLLRGTFRWRHGLAARMVATTGADHLQPGSSVRRFASCGETARPEAVLSAPGPSQVPDNLTRTSLRVAATVHRPVSAAELRWTCSNSRSWEAEPSWVKADVYPAMKVQSPGLDETEFP